MLRCCADIANCLLLLANILLFTVGAAALGWPLYAFWDVEATLLRQVLGAVAAKYCSQHGGALLSALAAVALLLLLVATVGCKAAGCGKATDLQRVCCGFVYMAVVIALTVWGVVGLYNARDALQFSEESSQKADQMLGFLRDQFAALYRQEGCTGGAANSTVVPVGFSTVSCRSSRAQAAFRFILDGPTITDPQAFDRVTRCLDATLASGGAEVPKSFSESFCASEARVLSVVLQHSTVLWWVGFSLLVFPIFLLIATGIVLNSQRHRRPSCGVCESFLLVVNSLLVLCGVVVLAVPSFFFGDVAIDFVAQAARAVSAEFFPKGGALLAVVAVASVALMACTCVGCKAADHKPGQSKGRCARRIYAAFVIVLLLGCWFLVYNTMSMLQMVGDASAETNGALVFLHDQLDDLYEQEGCKGGSANSSAVPVGFDQIHCSSARAQQAFRAILDAPPITDFEVLSEFRRCAASYDEGSQEKATGFTQSFCASRSHVALLILRHWTLLWEVLAGISFFALVVVCSGFCCDVAPEGGKDQWSSGEQRQGMFGRRLWPPGPGGQDGSRPEGYDPSAPLLLGGGQGGDYGGPYEPRGVIVTPESIVAASRRRVRLGDIRFSQTSIGNTFRDGRPLHQTIQELRQGRITLEQLPLIRVVEYNRELVALDNRRLYCLQIVFPTLKQVEVWMVPLAEPRLRAEFFQKLGHGGKPCRSVVVRRGY